MTFPFNLLHQVIATRSDGQFVKNVRYYFVGVREPLVVFATFVGISSHAKRRVCLLTLHKIRAMEALDGVDAFLVSAEPQRSVPEWLTADRLETVITAERLRPGRPKRTYVDAAEERLRRLEPALARKEEILGASNPLAILAKIARSLRIHPTRYQTHFFAYVLHGSNLLALLSPIDKIGRYDRTDPKRRGSSWGRRALTPTVYGSCCAQAERMVRFFLRRARKGETIKNLHLDFLIKELRCDVSSDGLGQMTIIHPLGEKIPSYGSFRYHVVTRLGLSQVHETLQSHLKARARRNSNVGNYGQRSSRVMQDLAADGYFVSMRATQEGSDRPAPALCVVRGTCTATSFVAGVGFSVGGEKGEAYRAMLFCCCAPRTYIEKLYGLREGDLARWVVTGVSPAFTSDRGPAGGRRAIDERVAELSFPIKAITPTGQAQSNAFAESSHPRGDRADDSPGFHQLSYSNADLMRRELLRAQSDNFSSSVVERLSETALAHFDATELAATPHNYVKYLQERFQVSGEEIPLEVAVRAFWTEADFRFCVDGLHLVMNGTEIQTRFYTSQKLIEKGLIEKNARLRTKVKGFILTASLKHVWINIGPELMELDATLRTPCADEDKAEPAHSVVNIEEARRRVAARTRRSSEAETLAVRKMFTDRTGYEWDEGHRKRGRAPRQPGRRAN